MATWRDRLGALGRDVAGAVVDNLLKAEQQQDEGQDRTPGGSNKDSAKNAPVPQEPASTDPKSIFWDPFSVISQLGYKDRPSSISYDTQRAMVYKMPILQAIIQTRVNQVASFSSPQRDRYQLGFRVTMRDPDDQPTPADKEWMKQMESLLTRTGVTENPRGRPTFEAFLRKFAWDSLVYDQACFEIVPNRKGQPAEWYAIDAKTIRIADTASLQPDEDDLHLTRHVQIYDNVIVNEYTQEELCFGVRNPRTDIRLQGYGTSEAEMLMVTITALLHSWQYNQRFFSQGSAAKGILNFKGAVPEHQLRSFRRMWYSSLASVQNAWKTPITNADDLQWINLQTSNRDMEFSAWFDFQIKIACAIFSMDPGEINFRYGNTGQKGALSEANNKEKITESKERGLRPLLRFIQSCINQHILWPINENFRFEFVGLDARTQEEVADLAAKRVKTYITVDELRAEDGLEPLPDGKGEIILDPTWFQSAQQKDGAAQAEAEGGGPDFGGGGDEGGDEEVDFETLLAGARGGDEGDEGDEPAKPAKPAEKDEAQKSWVLDVRI